MAKGTVCSVAYVFVDFSTRPHPVILIGHFFAVALYAVYRVITSCKIWQLHHGIYRSGTLFIKACSIIFPLIKSEILLF